MVLSTYFRWEEDSSSLAGEIEREETMDNFVRRKEEGEKRRERKREKRREEGGGRELPRSRT